MNAAPTIAARQSRAVVVLLSGGVESSTLLHEEARHSVPTGVFIDYGQRAARRELAAARIQCRALGARFVRLDIAAAGRTFRAGQTHRLHVPLPHRNLVILSLGLSYCAQIGAVRLAIALNSEDAADYASATPQFIEAFGRAALDLDDIAVVAPLVVLTKAQTIEHGLALDVDYALTYSCLLGGAKHCGRCPQCRKRRAAFATAGIVEAPDFYRAID